MNRAQLDDLLQDLNSDNHHKSTTRVTKQKSHDDLDDWFDFDTDTKKSSTSTTVKRQDEDINDDDDHDDAWNRTGGSAAPYVPTFGGVGTLASTFPGQDTVQRIISQPRSVTSTGDRKFDDLFGSSPTKTTTTSIDADKNKKTVRFDEPDLMRPSTAPSPVGTAQSQSNTRAIASMRTGLEPTKFSETFPSSKASTESSKDDNWLGVKDDFSFEDPLAQRPTQKTEPAVTNVVKKAPIDPFREAPAIVPEPSKKTPFDILEEDRQLLKEKSVLSPSVLSTNASQDFVFGDQTTSNRRPATAGPLKTLLFADDQPIKSTTKSSYDPKPDFGHTSSKNLVDDSIFTSNRANPSSSINFDTKKYEYENNELKMTLEHIKRQHDIEINMLDEGYKHRLEYVEKSCERRESRLKEENEHLLRQLTDRTQQYENEKSAFLLDHQRRLDDLQRDRTTELENLRTLQRQTVDHLRREHEQTILRLKQLKQEELSTALDVTTHTRAFESVIDHMEQNAKNIDTLRLKIEAKHSSALTDKEIEARAKEQQLKAYEERLHIQATDFERERKNLQELISRLEVHLSEQTKLVEEERWKALQSQKRMEAMQDALNGEQRLFMEKLSRDRSEIQRSKDQLLDDQKIALSSIYESRSQLANERAKIEALQKNFSEQKHRDMLQNATMDAETRAQQKLASEQLARLEKREHELVNREEALLLERRSLSELKQRLDVDQSTMRTQQEELKQRQLDIEHANELIKKERERLSQLYYELHALDGKSTGRLQELQKSISTLRQQEEHMNERYSRMANERDTLNHLRSSVPYSKQAPKIDSGFSTLQLASTSPLLPPNSTQQSLEDSTVLRALRVNALQDQLYIQDEMSFLHSLRAGNHRTSRSASLSKLPRHSESNLLRTNN